MVAAKMDLIDLTAAVVKVLLPTESPSPLYCAAGQNWVSMFICCDFGSGAFMNASASLLLPMVRTIKYINDPLLQHIPVMT